MSEKKKNKKKSILLITHSSALAGGGEIEFLRLQIHLKKDYKIFLVIPEGSAKEIYTKYADEFIVIPSRVFQVDPDSIKEYIKFFLIGIVKLRIIFPFIAKHRNEIDICYANSSVCFIELLPVIFFRINYVLSVKEVIQPDFIRKIIFRWLSLSAKKIMVISEYIKQKINFIKKKNQVVVIHSTINEKKYLDLKEKFIKNTPSEDGYFEILNIGPFYKLKNQHVLINALKNFKVSEKIKVKFIGKIVDLEYYNFCNSLVDKTYLKDSIEFLGEKNQDDTINEILKSQCLVITSTREGFSLVLLEGLLLEVPVITTSVGVIPEVIKNYENGLTFNYDDSSHLYRLIEILKNNKDLYNKIKLNSLPTYYLNFNEESSVNKIDKVIIEALKNN